MTKLEYYAEQIDSFRSMSEAQQWFTSVGNMHTTTDAQTLRSKDNYVRGCCPNCKVWCDAKQINGIWQIRADSDNQQLKSLCKILVDVYNNSKSSDIQKIKYRDFHSISKVLSAEKQKGLQSLINRIHSLCKNT